MSEPAKHIGKHMEDAIALAARGLGRTSPNPLVGAVIVRHGRVAGRGFHQKYGGPHAEVFALRDAGEKARGATLFCTLEPCNHHGKTPPCARAIIQAGIAKVVLGARDPNPVAGGGIETLRAAGIDVVTGVLEEKCKALNAPFFKTVQTGRPFVTLKWAMTLDGRIATASGDSKWISNEASREYSHRLRACHDAVLCGVGTVLADNPRLDVRLPGVAAGRYQPRRVILDSTARLPVNAALWDVPNAGTVTVITTPQAPARRKDALRNRGAAVLSVAAKNERPDVEALLSTLSELGVNSVLVEGGSAVLGAIAESRQFDALRVFVAPKLAGGGLSVLSSKGAAVMADAIPVGALRQIRSFDGDILLGGETQPHLLDALTDFCTLQTSE